MKHRWIVPAVISAMYIFWGIIDEFIGIPPTDQVCLSLIFGAVACIYAIRPRP